MSKRIDVSTLQNRYHDGHRLDQDDLDVEQNKNNQTSAAIINNHFGSGVLLSSIVGHTIFDSDHLSPAFSGLTEFDGTCIGDWDSLDTTLSQPSDPTLGNQLEVELSGSSVVGRFGTKVAIIGLSFDGTIQMDRLSFYKNEKQVTSKHYAKVLGLFFNDFKGNENCSINRGGRVVIRETASFQTSRDPIMISQDVEPDIFWRDFKIATTFTTLAQMLQGIGTSYSIDGLNINTTGMVSRELLADDVVSHVGQKFIASCDNIQKITLLLGAAADISVPNINKYDWTGDIVVSVYALQNTVDCPSDIVPGLAIDFDPSGTPLVQLSYNQNTLKENGYVLTDALQPVDFTFSKTKLNQGNTSKIIPGEYYAVTVKRSGGADNGTILLGTGRNRTDDSRLTLFSGIWIDVPDEDLWFQVWSDSLKVSDGQGYDLGNGVYFPKVILDVDTGATIDNENGGYSITNTGRGITNTVVLKAVVEESFEVQDERTGNPIFSRKQFVPSLSFETDSGLATLKKTIDPFVIGAVSDNNPKYNTSITGTQKIPGLVIDNKYYVVNRQFDSDTSTFNILSPDSDLINQNLVGSRLFPNSDCLTCAFTIVKVTLCTGIFGDVNGDGIVDLEDHQRASELVGEDFTLTSTQTKILNGEINPFEILRANVTKTGLVSSSDVVAIQQYINKESSPLVGGTFTYLTIEVQSDTGRYDTFYDCGAFIRLDGVKVDPFDSVDPLPPEDLVYYGYNGDIAMQLDPTGAFLTIPFADVDFKILPRNFWQPDMLSVNSSARLVPAAFTDSKSIVHPECDSYTKYECIDLNNKDVLMDAGRNDYFVPDNLYIGNGEILRQDGKFYKVDLEIGTIELNLPAEEFNNAIIDVMSVFVVDNDNSGFTVKGYPAMRYSDCSTVQSGDIAAGRVRFGVSIQSVYKNIEAYDSSLEETPPPPEEDGYGIVVDDLLSFKINHSTGALVLNASNLSIDDINNFYTTILIQVFLKKAGWNNNVLSIKSNEVMGVISA